MTFSFVDSLHCKRFYLLLTNEFNKNTCLITKEMCLLTSSPISFFISINFSQCLAETQKEGTF